FSGPNDVQNIISRVTGGNPSNIDGLIRLTIPNADFYFLNPYGIMFGPNARLDVQGSFHASTADYLRLGENGRFDARSPSDSLLTIAPVEAFGFLTDSPASIGLKDSKLSVSEGKTLSLIGGDLTMNGELLSISGKVAVFSKEFTTQLDAPNGRINLASTASKGEVIPTESGLDVNARTGNFIIDHSKITTSGKGGGDIFIRAGLLKLINSDITGDTFGGQPGGMIDILADNIILDGAENYSYISSSSFGSGTGGRINLSAKYQDLSNGAIIQAASIGIGSAGSISINVAETLSFSGKYMYEIQVPSVISTITFGIGQGGNIEVEAQNLDLTNGAQIGSNTFGSGKGGNVSVKVTDTLTLSGKDKIGIMSSILAASLTLPNVTSSYNIGDAGNIELEAGKINLFNGGKISTNSLGLGNAGFISVKTNELTASGGMFSEMFDDYITSGISSNSKVIDEIGGKAGNIMVDADIIRLTDKAKIATLAANSSGGNIEINTTNYIMLQGGKITTSVYGGIGDGGNIMIKNPTFVVLNQGQIKAQADAGNGGNINLKSNHLISSPNSLISASSRLGLDGQVRIDSPDMDIARFLVILSDDYVDVSNQIKKTCRMRDSSFFVHKINGSPQTPYDYQPAQYLPETDSKIMKVSMNPEEKIALSTCKK
ncbi:MAG: filamentous hemagglutinin N-terminal domain-containing protein, partial [Candidatus Marithrix sp.]|nr:filamentous hemagglutinin N-terminal domain-containing protein [Candidatus Marithrix sp.]